VVTFNNTN